MAETPQTPIPPESEPAGTFGENGQRRRLSDRIVDGGARSMSRLGSRLHQAAENIDRRGMAGDGRIRRGERRLAGRLEHAASYFETSDPRELLSDVDGMIRRHPYRTMAVGLFSGWVIGRILRRKG